MPQIRPGGRDLHDVAGAGGALADRIIRAPADATMTTAPANLAVLFADVSGSTRLYEELGDQAALAAIGRCLRFVEATCAGHQGRLVKTIGDEAMVVFPSADLAADAAGELQGRIAEEEPAAGAQRMALRIGFHYGPALESAGDVFGDSVNLAARLVGFAQRAQVITSEETIIALSPWRRARTREIHTLTVRGKQRDIRIFELIWQDAPEELTALATRPTALPARLALRHGERELTLGEDTRPVTLGRDAQNDFIIADRMASRMHARIERRNGKFVIVDHSSNGTYVTFTGEPQIPLRREELVLRGRGEIAFGHANADRQTEIVTFACEG
jgi:class 3 adenylate cyclase